MSNRAARIGGFGLYDLYSEAYSLETIRKRPSSIDELKSIGLTDEKINIYFSLIKQLYGELFLDEYMLLSSNIKKEAKVVWVKLYDFCVENNLARVWSDNPIDIQTLELPAELRYYPFVCDDEKCPGVTLINKFDDFRLEVERQLTGLSIDWYLSLRYNVYFVMPDDIPYLFHLDYSNKMAKLSELELKYLYNKIQSDRANCRIQIEANERRVPKFAVLDGETTIGAKHRWHEKCQEWLKKSLELQKEEELLEECEGIVSDIVESGAHNGIVSTYSDDTLYVHKGLLKCERDHHSIKQATAIMINKYGKDIKLNVSYCSDCKKYFIHYDIYKHYREVYGPILGNIKLSKNDDFYNIGYSLAEESPLRLCGYSVNQSDDLSQSERQLIIQSCIESGGMTKKSIIQLLRWFVEVNGNKNGNELARQKWKEDLDFVLNYNIDDQEKHQIKNIAIYSRNRFVTKEF